MSSDTESEWDKIDGANSVSTVSDHIIQMDNINSDSDSPNTSDLEREIEKERLLLESEFQPTMATTQQQTDPISVKINFIQANGQQYLVYDKKVLNVSSTEENRYKRQLDRIVEEKNLRFHRKVRDTVLWIKDNIMSFDYLISISVLTALSWMIYNI